MTGSDMSSVTILISSVISFAAVLLVYVAFVAHAFLKASRDGYAVGIGVLAFVVVSPFFWITAVIAFVLAFYAVARS
jgi:hypothetical protein